MRLSILFFVFLGLFQLDITLSGFFNKLANNDDGLKNILQNWTPSDGIFHSYI